MFVAFTTTVLDNIANCETDLFRVGNLAISLLTVTGCILDLNFLFIVMKSVILLSKFQTI